MEEIKKLHMIAEYLQKKNKLEWVKLLENLIDYVESNLDQESDSDSDSDDEWTPKEWTPEDDCPEYEAAEDYIMTNDSDCF
jgi:hypothetical protein